VISVLENQEFGTEIWHCVHQCAKESNQDAVLYSRSNRLALGPCCQRLAT